jgi:hypothetical protein
MNSMASRILRANYDKARLVSHIMVVSDVRVGEPEPPTPHRAKILPQNVPELLAMLREAGAVYNDMPLSVRALMQYHLPTPTLHESKGNACRRGRNRSASMRFPAPAPSRACRPSWIGGKRLPNTS